MSGENQKELRLKLKYADIPEKLRYKKKKKKVHIRSDHKHRYACLIADSGIYIYRDHKKNPAYDVVTYCVICGRIHDTDFRANISNVNLPVFKGIDIWDKKINLEDISIG